MFSHLLALLKSCYKKVASYASFQKKEINQVKKAARSQLNEDQIHILLMFFRDNRVLWTHDPAAIENKKFFEDCFKKIVSRPQGWSEVNFDRKNDDNLMHQIVYKFHLSLADNSRDKCFFLIPPFLIKRMINNQWDEYLPDLTSADPVSSGYALKAKNKLIAFCQGGFAKNDSPSMAIIALEERNRLVAEDILPPFHEGGAISSITAFTPPVTETKKQKELAEQKGTWADVYRLFDGLPKTNRLPALVEMFKILCSVRPIGKAAKRQFTQEGALSVASFFHKNQTIWTHDPSCYKQEFMGLLAIKKGGERFNFNVSDESFKRQLIFKFHLAVCRKAKTFVKMAPHAINAMVRELLPDLKGLDSKKMEKLTKACAPPDIEGESVQVDFALLDQSYRAQIVELFEPAEDSLGGIAGENVAAHDRNPLEWSIANPFVSDFNLPSNFLETPLPARSLDFGLPDIDTDFDFSADWVEKMLADVEADLKKDEPSPKKQKIEQRAPNANERGPA